MSTKWIVFSVGSQFGGVGKTTASVQVAEYLRSLGMKIAVVDADQGKWGMPSSFSYFFGGQARRLNIQSQQDLDGLLEMTAESEADAVICDAPANAGASLSSWWHDVATKETLDAIGLSLVVLGSVTPLPGSAQTVFKSINDLGDRATYLIALNRITLQSAEGDPKEVFPDWFSADTSGLDLKTFEIPHVQSFAMTKFVDAGKLPSKLNGEVTFLIKSRIAIWTERIQANLAATGLFERSGKTLK
jgi:AAA domain